MKKNYIKSIIFAFPILFISIGTFAQTPCQTLAYGASQANYTSDEEIFNVTVGTLNNTSSCGTTGPGPGSINQLYSNYTGVVAAPLFSPLSTYTISVTIGQCGGGVYGAIAGAWIDFNQNGSFTDPGELVFTSVYGPAQIAGTIVTGTILIPANALTGTTRMRVIAIESSVLPSPVGTYFSWGETEDYCVNIAPATPCTGQPDPNTILGPNYQLCPGSTASLALANSYTPGGITYSWSASNTSSVGPFNSINNASLTTLTSGALSIPTWFQCVITCTNSNSFISPTFYVNIAGTTTNSVPYFEGFEAIGMNNLLPNCSWSSTGTGGACQTFTGATTGNRSPRTGNKFGVFNSSTGTFYSNGIQLNPGVTYSTSLWFKTDVAGAGLNWKNLAISAGPAQSAAGQVTVCETNGVAISGSYKLLSNTFTVGSSGMYYFGISATYSGSGAPYLTWDDFEVIAPCQLNPSSLVISSPVSTICAGQPIVLSVSGSANSFSWNNGSTGNLITAYPSVNTTYVVTATSILTGCSNTASKLIVVNPLPVISILTNNQSLCQGSSANLLAVGANTYLWSNGSAGAGLSVSPLVSTTYSVYGTNNFGCSSTTSQLINVTPLPVVTAVSVPSSICKGEGSTLVGSGAANYSWNSTNNYIQGGQVNVSPTASTMYTLTGTINGCTSTAFVSVIVYECVGINSLSSNSNDLKVYPNPSSSDITVELKKDGIYTIELIDVTGKVVLVKSTEEEKLNLNINFLSNGVYYLKAKSQNTMNVVKIIKN